MPKILDFKEKDTNFLQYIQGLEVNGTPTEYENCSFKKKKAINL